MIFRLPPQKDSRLERRRRLKNMQSWVSVHEAKYFSDHRPFIRFPFNNLAPKHPISIIIFMPPLRRVKSVQDLYILLDNLIPLKRCQLSYYDVDNFFEGSIWEPSRGFPPPLCSCKHLPSLRHRIISNFIKLLPFFSHPLKSPPNVRPPRPK